MKTPIEQIDEILKSCDESFYEHGYINYKYVREKIIDLKKSLEEKGE